MINHAFNHLPGIDRDYFWTNRAARNRFDAIHIWHGKKALVAEFIKLDDAKSTAFWKIYDNYEVERKGLGQKRIALLLDYAENFNAMDESKTDELMKIIMNQRTGLGKLIDK